MNVIGKTIASLTLSGQKEAMTIEFTDGSRLVVEALSCNDGGACLVLREPNSWNMETRDEQQQQTPRG